LPSSVTDAELSKNYGGNSLRNINFFQVYAGTAFQHTELNMFAFTDKQAPAALKFFDAIHILLNMIKIVVSDLSICSIVIVHFRRIP
jgi:hypothetical protein